MEIIDNFQWTNDMINASIESIQKWFDKNAHAVTALDPDKIVELKNIKDYVRK